MFLDIGQPEKILRILVGVLLDYPRHHGVAGQCLGARPALDTEGLVIFGLMIDRYRLPYEHWAHAVDARHSFDESLVLSITLDGRG